MWYFDYIAIENWLPPNHLEINLQSHLCLLKSQLVEIRGQAAGISSLLPGTKQDSKQTCRSFYFIFTLQYCIGFAIIDLNPLWVTCISHPESLSHLPPNPLPLGHPSAPAPSTLYHASNLDWRFVLYIIFYMFQCHSPISSHPHTLPESKRLFYTSVSLFLSHI